MAENAYMFEGTPRALAAAVDGLVTLCHARSRDAGWWLRKDRQGHLLDDDEMRTYVVATKLALAHSELSEALEGFRKGKRDEHLPHRSSIEVELADTLIRIFDLAGALNMDLGTAMAEKLAYNARRPDHKLEARDAAGGKVI